jgi:hypothetical protein
LGGWELRFSANFCKCETLPTLISSISWNKAVTTTVEGCYVVSTTDPTPQDGLLLITTTPYDITLQMLQIVVGRAKLKQVITATITVTVSCVYVYLF